MPDVELPCSVHLGDAFDLVTDLDDESIDLVLTSPPYWGLRSYGLDHDHEILQAWLTRQDSESSAPPSYAWYRSNGGVLGQEPYPEWYVANLIEFFSLLRPKLKAGGSIWLNIGDTYFARWSSIRDKGRQGIGDTSRQRRRTPSGGYLHDKQLLLIPSRVAIGMQDAGWILRNDVVWAKTNVMPRPEKDRLRLSHEHWFHFVKRSSRGRPKYYYDLDYAEAGTLDVISYPPSRGDSQHSATFPVELVRRRILTSSPAEGLVLDPFCGTGQALVAASQCGRRGIGFEVVKEYVSRSNSCLRELLTGEVPANQAVEKSGGIA